MNYPNEQKTIGDVVLYKVCQLQLLKCKNILAFPISYNINLNKTFRLLNSR